MSRFDARKIPEDGRLVDLLHGEVVVGAGPERRLFLVARAADRLADKLRGRCRFTAGTGKRGTQQDKRCQQAPAVEPGTIIAQT